MGHALRKEEPSEEVKETTYPITRKHGERVTCASLRKERNGEFFLKLGCGVEYRVSRQVIAEATATTARSTWASVRIGTESYRLNRSELRNAFQQLERQ